MTRLVTVGLFVSLMTAPPAAAQDASLEVTQGTLNQLLRAVGVPSNYGSYVPTRLIERVVPGIEICDELVGFLDCGAISPPSTKPGGSDRRIPLVRCRRSGGGFTIVPGGPAITWEWWVMNASFTVSNGSMSVTATVRRRAGATTTDVTDTKSAVVRWDAAVNRLAVDVSNWTLPLEYDGATITTIDVARYLEIAIPVPVQTMNVPLPNGSTRTINGRIVSASPQYQSGRVVLTLDLGF